ncbi:MAG: efflux RND transporter periplasmic adaptor subunit [Gammaproteobacteria bacterium]
MTSAGASRRRTLRRAVALLAVLALAAALVWLQRRPVEVDAVVVRTQPLQRTLLFSARVQTPARVEVGATLTGRVAQVLVDEGDAVAAGAPLLRLEDDELRAALAQARAALAQAQARLAAQRQVSRPGADAALAQAEATFAVAERELARSRELLAQGFVSSARLDEAQRALDIARAQRDAARAQAAAQRGDGAEAEAAQAQLEAARAALDSAQARLAQATLRAPAAARVIVRAAEPGQIVQPGRALLTLAVDGPTELVAPVDERFLAQLQPGQRAQVLADAYPARAFGARVVRLAPAVDAARGAVEVTLRPDGAPPDFLREDMTLSVEVVTGARGAARVLPLGAMRPGAGTDRAGVNVLRDGRVQAREVALGLRTLDQAEVLDGVADGDVVLLDPTLAPGTRVRARTVDAATALRPRAAATSRDSAGGGMGSAMSR